MRLRRQSALFKDTAIESLTLGIELFNRPSPLARDHAVIMMLAHSFEMLLKAAIFQRRGSVRERGDDLTHSLARCISICVDDLGLLQPGERLLLFAIKQDRDCATHESIKMSEELLWLHMRGAITIFKRVLTEEFDQQLNDLIPGRAIPVSVEPPRDLGALVEQELSVVRDLLAPRTRKTPEARARLRPLLSLDGAATGRFDPPTELEVGRAEQALRTGRDWRGAFPGLASLEIAPFGPSPGTQEVTLRITSGAGDVAVRRAQPGEEALTYRSTNPFDEFGIKLTTFGARLGISRHEGYALIHHLGIRDDLRSYFIERTPAGNVRFQGLSARALELGRAALPGIDLRAITSAYNAEIAARRIRT